ncbi:hypothetical protein [Chitinophaga tropicalis]|uniref:Uncharacterized protein n=1 Tax=Chitinophaga tropicalis TaxID=2683588 RepID=A0A7K1U5F4_9BACT|nr:hypothetical protein [Chitinophaga tropicalis]MVT09569.1 hypothetical protein [Chitinophaga tropicalis]
MDKHSFHIPVLGLGYSIDTPVKVARFGISSVISIVDDQLVERMRVLHCKTAGVDYFPITEKEDDYRAKRITDYLNRIHAIVKDQMKEIVLLPFEGDNDLVKYFELLPDSSSLKKMYNRMCSLDEGSEKQQMQQELRRHVTAGAIDVNIMCKLDRAGTDAKGNPLPPEYSDALAALRGFARSDLESSVVLSAGYNPALYSYIEQFPDFYPGKDDKLKKKLILKVSDYRSALVQGKILAKKGLWISEFRIESGLNCGGHAFATDGLLLGPILEEFKNKREELTAELFELCNSTLEKNGLPAFSNRPALKITVQGGIGTASEHAFLIDNYILDGAGWGSPFLLVPEATNVDSDTLTQLSGASKEDYYMSYASPLGVPFNNFRKSTSEVQRKERIAKNRPGSPCHKKYLVSNTEFTTEPICTASRQYLHLKIKELEAKGLPATEYRQELDNVLEKDCLCEGLGASALKKNDLPPSHGLTAVTLCPGPNLAYFSGVFSLAEMVGHIYGKLNLLNSLHRPNLFVNELHLYIDYLKKKLVTGVSLPPKQVRALETFKKNLLEGIEYYKGLATTFTSMKTELDAAAITLAALRIS